MKKITILIINLYQKTFSPDHGAIRVFFPLGVCRFYPSCSEYTKQSIKQYGITAGMRKGLSQLVKCQPYHWPIAPTS